MKKIFKKDLMYRYTYIMFAVVFAVSLLLLFFMRGIVPYGLSVVSSEYGFGTSLVLTTTRTVPTLNDTVAYNTEQAGVVTLYTITESLRESGTLTYKVTDVMGKGSDTQVIAARDMQQSVVFTIPALGSLVRAINHPIGAMALFGIPLVTFAIDFLLAMIGGLYALRNRFKKTTTAEVELAHTPQEESPEEYIEESEEVARPGLFARIFTRANKQKEEYEMEPAYEEGYAEETSSMTIQLPSRRSIHQHSNAVRSLGGIVPRQHTCGI